MLKSILSYVAVKRRVFSKFVGIFFVSNSKGISRIPSTQKAAVSVTQAGKRTGRRRFTSITIHSEVARNKTSSPATILKSRIANKRSIPDGHVSNVTFSPCSGIRLIKICNLCSIHVNPCSFNVGTSIFSA